jgi:hypothetical protein
MESEEVTMSQDRKPADIARAEVLCHLPGAEDPVVRRDLEYASAEGGALTLDLYRPRAAASRTPLPAVVIVAGYPGEGTRRILGCSFKEMGSTTSWARLIAASGMSAIAYTNRDPERDARALFRFVRENAAELGIDGSRLGLWASSGNAPLALSLLVGEEPGSLRCAALCYPYLLDLGGDSGVADAARQFGFVNPAAGRSIDDLPGATPLLLARAGRDETPRLNEGLDRFVAAALARNLPLVLHNHADAPHAFDLFHDSAATREAVRQVLAFLRFHLVGES